MDQAYCARQDQRDEQARKNWRAWVESLSPAQRAQLEKRGLDEPNISHQASHSLHDVSELPIPAPQSSYVESLEDVLAEEHGLNKEQAKSVAAWHRSVVEAEGIRHKAHLLTRIVGFLMMPGNIQMRAWGLAFATGLKLLDGINSQSEVARKLKVSRAAISKVTKQWQRELDLPTNEHNKSQAACEQYSKVQQEKHWRRDRQGRLKKLFVSHLNNNQGGTDVKSNQEERRKAGAAV